MTPADDGAKQSVVLAPSGKDELGFLGGCVRHVGLCLAVAAASACTTSPRFDGPLGARNQHPAQLVVGRLRPRSSEAVPAGSVDVDLSSAYTSLFLGGQGGLDTFRMDGEYLRTALAARIGLGAGFDLEIEVPTAHATGGFLDDFVIGWHDFFGFPDQGRDLAARDEFEVLATRGGQTVFEVEEDGLHVLDVPLVLGYELVPLRDGPIGVHVRGGVDLPVGSAANGYGNGSADWMFGLSTEWHTGPVAWNAHVDHTFVGAMDQASRAGAPLRDVTSGGVGCEWAIAPAWSWLAQVEYDRSTLRGLDLSRTSDDQWLLWLASRFRLDERIGLEVGLGEDLSQYIAPDFSAWLSVRYHFGPRRDPL